ncbi:hypothetical protein QR680_003313 [Steinernema hermaphroditum]|uniref:G-protein coupled receptors family 1 profile domain-containing protein n=1 Tax=Steinernema hermaphroditum TaxID=289476 RepID=A0AA39H6F9_9BILA|nr:hypothetical protein QR680_003313 [Steinernema hermaphroditum]
MSDQNSYREYNTIPTSEISTVPYYMYAVEGSFLFIVSLALVVLIIATSKLRGQKEFQIFILCVAFDAVFGVAYFSAGLYRIQLVGSYSFVPLKSRWECINMLHNHVFVFITPGAGILALITSIDRFISVFFPLKYIKIRSDRYFLMLVAILIIATTPTTVLSYLYSYHNGNEKDVNAMCLLVQGVTSEMFQILRAIRILTTIIAVVLYIPIAVRMYFIIKRSAAFNIKAGQASKLRRMTVTVSLITVSQLVLFTLPDTILFFNSQLQSMVFYVMNLNKGGNHLTNVVELACKRNPTLSMCGHHDHGNLKHKEPLPATLQHHRNRETVVVPEQLANRLSHEEDMYCRKNKLTFYRHCEGEEPPDEIKAQIIAFCQSYDRLCVLGRKPQIPPVESPALASARPQQQEQQEALVMKSDGTLVNCADPRCKANAQCWKTCRCARIDSLAREFCVKQQNNDKQDFRKMCQFWTYECTASSRGRAASAVEQQSDSSARDKDRKILHDRISAVFERRASDLPLFDEIRGDKAKPKAFQTKNYPLLPSDSSYGAGDFDTLTDTGGVLHRTRSRSPFTKPGLWEANPDNPHNRDHANKWYYQPQSVTVDWLSGQIAWGGHWAVPGAGVGGTNGFSTVHFPSIGTFLNIADDYD